MAKKALEPMTEPMFYVLLCFHKKAMCGTEISDYVRNLTDERVRLGPGTLYSILSTFQEEGLIEKMDAEGRRIPYRITEKGELLFAEEIARLKKCLEDAEREFEPSENRETTEAAVLTPVFAG